MKPPASWNASKRSHRSSSVSWTGSRSRPCAIKRGGGSSCRGTTGYLLSLRLRLQPAYVPLGHGSAHLVRVALRFGRAARDSPACDEDRGGEDSGRKQGTYRLSPGEDPVEPRVRNVRDRLSPIGAWVRGRDRPGQGRTRDGVTRAGRRRPAADHLPDGLRLSSSSTKPVHSEMAAPSRIRSPSSLIPAGSMNVTPARFRRRPLGGVCSSSQTRRSSSTQGPRSLPSSLSVGIESLAPSSTRVIFSTAGSHTNYPTLTTNTPSGNCTRGAKPPHRKSLRRRSRRRYDLRRF